MDRSRYTFAEYLALEQDPPLRHEYLDGAIYAMVDESREHAAVQDNITTALATALRDRPCRVLDRDARVRARAAARDLVTYPDAVVVCGGCERDPESPKLLRNPTLVVEVTSVHTDAYDRTTKTELYRAIPSLLGYLIVSHRAARVTCWWRPTAAAPWTCDEDVRALVRVPTSHGPIALDVATLYRDVAI